jgi:hypothetical protein
MTRHALVNKEGKVVNVIVWEGHPFVPPQNHMIVNSEVCDMGVTYDDRTETFTKVCNGKSYHRKTTYHEYINDTNS